MAKLECSSVFLLILFFSHSGAGESLFPFLPPFPGNINGSSGGGACGGAVCGRGNCVESNSSVLGFACSCDRGWKQAFDFGPCIVPNCTYAEHGLRLLSSAAAVAI
ncbi:hypothetical protein M569_07570 [Genlisea aurea]|uniref:EGF-like domain-containing protein n=1 Tax=Genlisea aurea TaxID=192259 RepID=S8CJH7_9LAMI|nr:hypothetical protein M569_07570 [Genlisea aurea]